jgi:Ca-activated chloride channel family protein
MKLRRLAQLAAAALCCAGPAGAPALAGMAPRAWTDLWRTPDQQGQALLEAGKPAQAAEVFTDPRRRAYADLEAGRYGAAARLLAPFKDPTSEYNRGNALARSGQLLAALADYDAALKQSPRDRDIRHNRDLVERELRKQRSAGAPRGGRQGGAGRQRTSSAQSPSAQSGQPGARRSSSGKDRRTGNGRRRNSAGGANAAQSAAANAGAGHPGANAARGSGQSGSAQGSQPASPNTPTMGSGARRDSANQARRDAEFAAGLERNRPASAQHGARGAQALPRRAPAPDAQRETPAGSPRRKPVSERTLALEQWLRQIPDSPAGLLRRKFMIQYMLKHPDASQEAPQ